MNITDITINDFQNASSSTLMERLSTGGQGLSSLEARARIKLVGKNLTSKKNSWMFIRYIRPLFSISILCIVSAFILSFFTKKVEAPVSILILLVFCLATDIWRNYRTQKTNMEIENASEQMVRTLRDNKWVDVRASNIVPGDIIRIRPGNIVPAEVKLIAGGPITVSTGDRPEELMYLEKKVEDVLGINAIVMSGEMNALVVATGSHLLFNKKDQAKNIRDESSSFGRIKKTCIYLAVLSGVVLFASTLISIFLAGNAPGKILYTLLLLAYVSPMSIIDIIKDISSSASRYLMKNSILMRKKISIEHCAAMDTFCSDKTTTLTTNEIMFDDIIPFGNYSKQDVLMYAAYASKAETLEPLDTAILKKANLPPEIGRYSSTEFQPFDPISKKSMAVFHYIDGGTLKVSKGSPNTILSLLKKDSELEIELNERIIELASNGSKALGVAACEPGGNWKYVGLIPIKDVPRNDSFEAISECRSLGIELKMLTGDHITIAKKIASLLMLKTNIISASILKDKTDEEALSILQRSSGVAEASPEQKFNILRLFKLAGKKIGFTGKGTDDLVCIREADMAYSLVGSTEAARSLSEAVLENSGLSLIINSIKTARSAIHGIRSFIIIKWGLILSTSLFAIIMMTAGSIAISISSILLFIFFERILSIILGENDEPIDDQAVRLGSRSIIRLSMITCIINLVFLFVLYFLGHELFHIGNASMSTILFIYVCCTALLSLHVFRTKDHLWDRLPSRFSSFVISISIFTVLLVSIKGIAVSEVSFTNALVALAMSALCALCIDIMKVRTFRDSK